MVERILRDQEIVGSNPTGCWAYFCIWFLSLNVSGVSLSRSFEEAQNFSFSIKVMPKHGTG